METLSAGNSALAAVSLAYSHTDEDTMLRAIRETLNQFELMRNLAALVGYCVLRSGKFSHFHGLEKLDWH